jgi:hypothetical protein
MSIVDKCSIGAGLSTNNSCQMIESEQCREMLYWEPDWVLIIPVKWLKVSNVEKCFRYREWSWVLIIPVKWSGGRNACPLGLIDVPPSCLGRGRYLLPSTTPYQPSCMIEHCYIDFSSKENKLRWTPFPMISISLVQRLSTGTFSFWKF